MSHDIFQNDFEFFCKKNNSCQYFALKFGLRTLNSEINVETATTYCKEIGNDVIRI